MSFLYKKLLSVFLIGSCFFSSSCLRSLDKEKEYKVEILLFGAHPLLVSVAQGIEDGANEKFSSLGISKKIIFTRQDANFQVAQATQQTRQAMLNNPSALVALGTPSIKVAFGVKNQDVPLFFAATSDPKSLGLAVSNVSNDWKKEGGIKSEPNVFGMITDFDYLRMAKLVEKTVELSKGYSESKNCVKVGYPLNESESNSVLALEKLNENVAKEKICFVKAPVTSPTEVPLATRSLLSQNVSIIQIGPDNTVAGGIGSILSIIEEKGIPILASERESVRKGALFAYGADFYQLGKDLGGKIANKLTNNENTSPSVEVFSKNKLYVNPKSLQKFLSEEALINIVNFLEVEESVVEKVE